jgi:hypothetical protein
MTSKKFLRPAAVRGFVCVALSAAALLSTSFGNP